MFLNFLSHCQSLLLGLPEQRQNDRTWPLFQKSCNRQSRVSVVLLPYGESFNIFALKILGLLRTALHLSNTL